MKIPRSTFINFLAFQVTWTLAMLSVSRGLAIWGAALIGLNVAAHLLFQTHRNRVRDTALILVGALVGVSIDASLAQAGFFKFAGSSTTEFLVLFYALWANFGSTLRISLAWTWTKLWAAAILGVIGGPLAYLAGVKLGAVVLPEKTLPSLIAVAIEFGVLTPAWIWVASRVLKEKSA